MRIIGLTIFFSFVLVLQDTTLFAQKRKPTSHFRGRYKSIKVPKSKRSVVCPIFDESQYPYQGLGIKLGDPFAVTYKLYPNEHFAVAVDFGSAASGLYSEYHRNNFGNYVVLDTLGSNQELSYLSHNVKTEWVLEGKLFFQRDASQLLDGLQWYVAAGWQWRQLDIDYEYLLETGFSEFELGVFNEKVTTMGPVGAFGFEYAYFTIPISAFIEVETYFDILDDPGWIRFQGGVGLRYVF